MSHGRDVRHRLAVAELGKTIPADDAVDLLTSSLLALGEHEHGQDEGGEGQDSLLSWSDRAGEEA